MASDTISNIEALYTGMSAASVKAAADLIVDARATYVLGVGIAHALARNVAYLVGIALETVVAIPKESSVRVDDLVRARAGGVTANVGSPVLRSTMAQSFLITLWGARRVAQVAAHLDGGESLAR